MVTASKKVQYCHANPLVLSLCFLKDLVSVFCGINALEIHQVMIRHHGPFLYTEAKDFFLFKLCHLDAYCPLVVTTIPRRWVILILEGLAPRYIFRESWIRWYRQSWHGIRGYCWSLKNSFFCYCWWVLPNLKHFWPVDWVWVKSTMKNATAKILAHFKWSEWGWMLLDTYFCTCMVVQSSF